MSGPFVADCSIGIGWVHPGQATDLTRRLLEDAKAGATVHVPSSWHSEIANALLAAVRRKLMAESHRQAGLALLGQLKVVVDHETSTVAFSTISDLALKHSLSAYDAAYLELARRKFIPLASRDEPLKAAAKKSGVKLL
ncbi:MAG: type II toxin-antitoxin system VapC family toxin [Verrucomicrobiota bacterium]